MGTIVTELNNNVTDLENVRVISLTELICEEKVKMY